MYSRVEEVAADFGTSVVKPTNMRPLQFFQKTQSNEQGTADLNIS